MARPGVATSAGLSTGRAAGAPAGSATPATKSAPGIWERSASDTRWNPYPVPQGHIRDHRGG